MTEKDDPRETVVTSKTTYDGITVLFWGDGMVTDAVGNCFNNGKRNCMTKIPYDIIFHVANDVAFRNHTEIADLIWNSVKKYRKDHDND